MQHQDHYPKKSDMNRAQMASSGSRTIFTLIVLTIVLGIAIYCAISFWGAATVVEPEPTTAPGIGSGAEPGAPQQPATVPRD
ncbi:MAG: hypothetical protein H0U74_03450 [Bradymonadaceae bacterium]|nr:hypothetical protein [Lujinxingiaceae bacterium]